MTLKYGVSGSGPGLESSDPGGSELASSDPGGSELAEAGPEPDTFIALMLEPRSRA